VDEILDITLHVARVLEQLGIPYLVAGSLASSLHGIPRATQDVDFVARLASWLPARRAARLDPVTALRVEQG
jgi:D-alanine-D-alanine ligase-like ATP-grasp enzyme